MFWLWLLCVCWTGHCFSQLPILLQSDTFPRVAEPYTWLFHLPDQLVYRYDKSGEWEKALQFRVENVTTCNALVIIEFSDHTVYFDPSGEDMGGVASRNFICRDSIVGEIGRTIQLFDNRPSKKGYSDRVLSEFIYGNCGFREADHVRGIEAYCLPQEVPYDAKMYFTDCNDLRNWGMLGVNAEWLIEPKFDKPFHFKNGIAEVIYYGEKRRINEKGEFVK